MSSCPPIRWGSRRATPAALLALILVGLLLIGAPDAAAQPPLVVVPSGAADGQSRLVVQVPEGGGPIPPAAFAASVDGVPQPVGAEPVLSDRMVLALVVDASAAGGPALPGGLSGAAGFVLAAPGSVRSTLVTDGTPPAVAVPWPAGPEATLRGLSAVRVGGERSTAAALELALAQLPAEATEPRLVVLYTGAPDAGAEPGPVIVERMRSAGVVLAVVGPAVSDFWSAVAAGTGGVAVNSGPAAAFGAFEQVASALQRRYLVTLPTPDRRPATVTVRVDTGSGPLTGEVAVPADPGPSPLTVLAVVLAVVLAGTVGLIALRRWRAGSDHGASGAPAKRRRAPAQQVWNVPARAENPVEREALLAELAATLHVGGPVWLRTHPDLAGVGTTTAMIDFAHRHRARYDVAWCISALDPDLVPDRMAELAEALELARPTDSADEATAALLEALPRRHRWLLVFDDAGSPHELARYLPAGPGDVLIASSDAGWRELASPVRVPAFTRAESVQLLRSGRTDLPVESADLLAASLGDLPLAVGPAAGLLADTDIDVDAFRALLPEEPADAPAGAGVAALWDVVLDRLATDDPQAFALLTLVAWLGQAPMPLSLVIDHPHKLPEPLGSAARRPAELAERTALLGRRGLARLTADDLLLHPVPAALLVARTGQDRAGDGGWTAITVRLLRAAAPDRPADEPADWPTWRRLLPHVLAVTDPARRLDVVADDVGWLLSQAGGYLAARGRTKAARALLEDAHEFDVGARLRAFAESAEAPTREDRSEP